MVAPMKMLILGLAVVGLLVVGAGCGDEEDESCAYGDMRCSVRASDGMEVGQACTEDRVWETIEVCQPPETCALVSAPTDLRPVCQ